MNAITGISFPTSPGNFYVEVQLLPNLEQTEFQVIDTSVLPPLRFISVIVTPTSAYALYYPNADITPTRSTTETSISDFGLSNPIEFLRFYFIGTQLRVIASDSSSTYSLLVVDIQCGTLTSATVLTYVTNDVVAVNNFASNSQSFQYAFPDTNITSALDAYNNAASQSNFQIGADPTQLCSIGVTGVTIFIMALTGTIFVLFIILALVYSSQISEYFFWRLYPKPSIKNNVSL